MGRSSVEVNSFWGFVALLGTTAVVAIPAIASGVVVGISSAIDKEEPMAFFDGLIETIEDWGEPMQAAATFGDAHSEQLNKGTQYIAGALVTGFIGEKGRALARRPD